MTATRYLALTGDPTALADWLARFVPPSATPQRLNRVFDAPDLVIFASPEARMQTLEEERGLVIGRLFRGAVPSERVERLTDWEGRHAAWSRGRSLLEGKWGSFVAFLRDEGAVSVIRAPPGLMPAYYCESGGLQVYFSHAELLADLKLDGAAVDDEFLRQWLTYPFLRTARTGLSGRFELLPGTVRSSTAGAVSLSTIWSPWRAAAAERQIFDFGEAARRVRETTLATVPVQVAEVKAPVLELSGGLDSSIVAACLAQAGVEFRAANFVTATPDGDERDYARLVASSLELELAELPEERGALDLCPPRRALRPPLSPVLQPLHGALSRYARETGSADFVTGAGGDNLFCYLTTAAPILDAAGALGLRAALATLRDVATLGDSNVWKAAQYALRKRLVGRRRPLWKRDERFLVRTALAGEPGPHPWLDRPNDAQPGKIEHVESLVLVQHFLDPEHVSGEALHHPLLNQPLIELCLGIPTWLWLRGGLNRAVARAAFADLLPGRVLRRRTKGRLESMCARAFTESRAQLADLLLGGELAARGLIDRPGLGAYLAKSGGPRDDAYFRVFDLVSLELWLRSWRR